MSSLPQISRIPSNLSPLLSAKAPTNPSTPPKYCSSACRTHHHRPSPTDTLIRDTFLSILPSFPAQTPALCSAVESAAFNSHNLASTSQADEEATKDRDGRDVDAQGEDGGTEKWPAERQKEGMQKARERELVRRCARRMVVFGIHSRVTALSGSGADEAQELVLEDGRTVEAVQNGRVVEASFAKGEWGLRWKV